MAVVVALWLPAGPAMKARQGQVVPAQPSAPEIQRPVGSGGPPLEAAGPPAAPPGQAAAPAPESAAPAVPEPYALAWTAPIDRGTNADTDFEMIATASVVITGAPTVPLEARALSDGHVVWTSPLTSRAFVRADDLVYGLDDGQVYALAAASGEPRWQLDTDEPGRGLAVGTDLLLVLSEHAVRAFGRDDGAPAWRTPLPAPAATMLAVSATLAVVGLEDRSLLAFDPATGVIRWRTSFDDVPRAVTLAGDRVYLTLPLVAVCAVLPSSGRLDWCTAELRVPAVGPPVIYADRLYLALLDTTLRAFDPNSGTMLRRDSLRGRPASAPMIVGAILLTPLLQNAFAVVRPSGALTVVPAPGAPRTRSVRRVTMSEGTATVVVLTVEVAGRLHLSAYTLLPAVASSNAAAPRFDP